MIALIAPLPAIGQQAAPPPPTGQPGAPPATGQPGAPPGAAEAAFSPEQLEQLAAPIALYPDPLVPQDLMASTCALGGVQAAQLANDHPDPQPDPPDRQLQEQ